MKIYKLAFASMVAGFATAAVAAEIAATATVAERKSCDEIAAEIAELSEIMEPDADTVELLTKLKQQQRSLCQKRAGARGVAAKNARRTPVTPEETASITASEPESESGNKSCETPDENGCCPGEKYTDMGELGFNCCPETGGDCFPPMVVSVDTESEEVSKTEAVPEAAPELTDQERIENIESGLCADGSQPNKFGCCGDEVFKDMGNTVFACCPKSGGDCFPPIK